MYIKFYKSNFHFSTFSAEEFNFLISFTYVHEGTLLIFDFLYKFNY